MNLGSSEPVKQWSHHQTQKNHKSDLAKKQLHKGKQGTEIALAYKIKKTPKIFIWIFWTWFYLRSDS
jgi:hypothetical protein